MAKEKCEEEKNAKNGLNYEETQYVMTYQ